MAYKQKPMTFGEGTGLTTTPNPTTKAVHRKFDTDDEMTDADMENKSDFNISNLHKDTKISLDKKKKALNTASNKSKKIEPSFPATLEGSKQRSAAEKALEAKEDAKGL